MEQIGRLRALAQQAVEEYQSVLRSGGEPVYPEWVDDILAVCDQAEARLSHGQITKPAPAQPQIH